MEQRFSDVATQPTKTVYHVRMPILARASTDPPVGSGAQGITSPEKQQESPASSKDAGGAAG